MVRFWVNTVLSGLIPGGFGHARTLRKYRDRGYRHEVDKAEVRLKHNGESGWKNEVSDGVKYRDYSDYQEYVDHQKTKFDEIIKLSGGFGKKQIIKYRFQFFNRFKELHRYLKPDAVILCAGARQGTEVEVLRELGYHNAYGIDLNPGPENELVKPGDFFHLDVKDHALDLIYSNAVDHAFNLHDLFKEHARAIKADGFAYYDIAIQNGGPFEAVQWESDEIVFKLMLEYFKTIEFVQIDKSRAWKSVLLRGSRLTSKN